ncbi:MAG: Thiol:disulfide oxidoreductase related to ResA [uncultured Propionibacteriaceae bacterium]|uniref:Thiol:disulfide oxidoreductase related to ResA n=1 Tax=uncultured Propionibacteriaceae bacterium TaxID=257457 RepID=A0A6J4NHC2_9ACTN|nr:MAG: Thiol:disulfide oxidoreductase related to ResA [uncultured Propionibacteriaceae bacterium]
MPERARHGVRSHLAAAGLSLLLLTAACSSTGADEQRRSAGQNGYVGGSNSLTRVAPADRKTAPEAAGTELGSSATISTGQYAGKVVVLNVWGSWCSPCRYEAPDLQAASVETAKVAQFVGLNTRDSDQAPAQAFVRAFDITYPSIYDPTGAVLLNFASDLPPTLIPSTLIIDGQGRIAVRIVGTISKITLVDLVNDVAAGK